MHKVVGFILISPFIVVYLFAEMIYNFTEDTYVHYSK